MEALRTLIIGCGNIAGGFDEGRPADALPYTHAGAYARDGRYAISACVEPDEARRQAFMDAWAVPRGFASLEQAMEHGGGYDVISICSPTPFHATDLEMSIRMRPRLIFCEKPVTTSLAETERLCSACDAADIPLAVNYTRRWDPDVARLREDIRSGRWGTLRSAVGCYNKGILNNGSHMLDLLHLLVGPMQIVRVGSPVHDFFSDDPAIPAWLEGPGGEQIQLVCGHAADYAIFELQLVFSEGVVVMEDGGMAWRERHVVDSETFKGYRVLQEGGRRAGEYPYAMLRAVGNIHDAIRQSAPLASTGETALAAQRICHQIRQLA